MIGCRCQVCRSDDARDKRLRTAALVSIGNTNIAIDCGPDFRQQMLHAGIEHLDAIIITHEHNDHVIGLDDVRPFNFLQRRDMPVYATTSVGKELETRFAYVFNENPYPGAPRITLIPINKDQVFEIKGIPIRPIEVMHGSLPILGFRISDFAYLTDVLTISEEERSKLDGVDTLVLNALHHEPHATHLNLEQALAMISRLNPRRTFLTHMSHRIGLHAEVNRILPSGVALAHDDMHFYCNL